MTDLLQAAVSAARADTAEYDPPTAIATTMASTIWLDTMDETDALIAGVPVDSVIRALLTAAAVLCAVAEEVEDAVGDEDDEDDEGPSDQGELIEDEDDASELALSPLDAYVDGIHTAAAVLAGVATTLWDATAIDRIESWPTAGE